MRAETQKPRQKKKLAAPPPSRAMPKGLKGKPLAGQARAAMEARVRAGLVKELAADQLAANKEDTSDRLRSSPENPPRLLLSGDASFSLPLLFLPRDPASDGTARRCE